MPCRVGFSPRPVSFPTAAACPICGADTLVRGPAPWTASCAWQVWILYEKGRVQRDPRRPGGLPHEFPYPNLGKQSGIGLQPCFAKKSSVNGCRAEAHAASITRILTQFLPLSTILGKQPRSTTVAGASSS